MPVPRVLLSVTLAGPAPSGSAGTSRLRRGCSHPSRHLPGRAAPSFGPLLRQEHRCRSSTSTRIISASRRTQAWIETLFGHVKGEWPHLEKIRDPGDLVAELDRVRAEYNSVRLHAGIGYVTPDDEHHGRGEAIRQARRDGMARARQARLDYRRTAVQATP